MGLRIVFHHSDKDRERHLAGMFQAGARRHGHRVDLIPLQGGYPASGYDLAVMVGVKSEHLWRQSRAAGQRTLMLDKGYCRARGPHRTWEYWRMSLDAQQPTTTTLMHRPMLTDRLKTLGMEPKPWRVLGSTIIVAGSSAKFHAFHGLPDPTEWATRLIRKLRKLAGGREIIYRPKPSWQDAVPIPGSTYSPERDALGHLLTNAHCLVTYGSNACFDAIMAGVPAIILGDGVGAPISSTELTPTSVAAPIRSGDRTQWAANLAYHQWTEEEMQLGRCWPTIGEWIDAI